jgi:HK97 family phage prohead protease
MLSGYAAVFDSLSVEMGPPSRRFRERIAPGAFRSALEAVRSGANVFAFYHHGLAGGEPLAAMPLGSTRDGSLRVQEDGRGLAFELDLPETSDGRDLKELVQRGTVRGVSFSWPPRAVRDTWHNDGGSMVRTLHEIRTLVDISPTHMPAYEETALAVRSLDAWTSEQEQATAAEGEAAGRRRRLRLAELDLTRTGEQE